MRIELLLALAMTACTSIRPDLASVRDATHARIADVMTDVDPAETPEARSLLTSPIDADTAVRIALLDNRELRATLREMGIPRGRLAQASTLPNPVGEIELQPERDSAVSLRAEYDITGILLAPMRARAVGPEVDAARLRAAAAVVETGYAARVAFYGLAAAQQKLEVANRALDALAASRDAADALFRAGNIQELDLATQDAAYQTERADVAQMELGARTAREALARVLNIHGPDVEIAVRAPFDPVPDKLDVPANLEANAIRASFDLEARSKHLEGIARRAGLTRLEGWLPDVALDVHGLSPRAAARDPSEAGWLVSGGVRLTVPLFDQKRGAAAALDATFEAELERYYGLANDIRSFVRTASARLVTAHARAHQYQSVIAPARKRVVDQAVLQYNAMHLGIFQLLGAKRDALLAELASIDAARDYYVARAAFDAAMSGHTVETQHKQPMGEE